MSSDNEPSFDLEAYLSRIGYTGGRKPSLRVLEALHLAHATHIPFENLDILLGRPIRLDLRSVQTKLVTGRRGGYCFEQNTLFAAALENLGFPVTRLAARARLGASRVLPRTHMLLLIKTNDGSLVADVGFGAEGLLKPVPLTADRVVRHYGWSYRVRVSEDLWVLQSLHGGAWQDLYAFTLEPQSPVDYEMASYYTSTHPTSIFVKAPIVQLPTPDARYLLCDREFTVSRGESTESRIVENDEALLRVLAATFGLEFPSGTRFPHLDIPCQGETHEH